ncbi:MAG: sodium:solute symporter family transporter [Saprospiraceae bacterium]
MNFGTIDITIFIGYILLMVGFGIWLSKKDGNESSKDYFLASGALPWWAVGGSLIASNISTEQILGMNGSGYVMGLAIGAYELLAAVTLLVVAKFFLPIFIRNGIYTMPQFLEKRFNGTVRTIMAFFWVALFLFVNITSIFYLGGLAIETISGVNFIYGVMFLALYSAAFSIFGGLKAVVWTDVAQVVVLVIGGLMACYFVVSAVGDGGFFDGMSTLYAKAPEKFDLILSKDNLSYDKLPGVGVLIGGMWIANIYYWGNNQYIIQRALAAKSIEEAQKGVAFAALLKLLMPLIVVVPGIAAFVLAADIVKPDQAFPWVLNNYVGVGFKGLVFAALVAAIGSSISSMVNSVSTIFTLDIYKTLINKDAEDGHYVRIGKITAAVALFIGVVVAPTLANLDQVFQYIQEYTGFISSGVTAVFIFGIFWKRTTSNAALAAILASVPINLALKEFFEILPFLDRMAFTFLIISVIIVVISLVETKGGVVKEIKDKSFRLGLMVVLTIIPLASGVKMMVEGGDIPRWFSGLIIAISLGLFAVLYTERNSDKEKQLIVEENAFKTTSFFNIASIVTMLILAFLYAMFW